MKKKFLTLILMVLLCGAVLTGCSGCNNIKLKNYPDANSAITSNGGLVVQQGNYIYFANGYQKTESLSNGDNDYGKVTYSAIYRAKVNGNNQLSYDVTVDEDENETKTLKDVELLIPKVVSCETCSFYVFGNYIYYASPTTEKNSSGKSRFDLVTFFCCKLDGSGTKKIYATDEYGDSAKFNMINYGGKVYIEIFDGTKITIVTVEGNKNKGTKTISENATFGEVIFPVVSAYNPTNNTTTENDACVYYTRKIVDGERETNGNVLCKASVTNAEELVLIKDNMSTIKLIDYADGVLYYNATNNNSEDYIVYSSDVNTISAEDISLQNQLSLLDTDDIYVIHSRRGMGLEGVVCKIDSSLRLVVKGQTDPVVLYNEAVTVLTVEGNYVFAYNSSNQIIAIALDTAEVITLTSEDDTLYFSAEPNFDICGNYIYYFNTYTGESTGYYLNRVEIAEDCESELLGVVDSKYIASEDKE